LILADTQCIADTHEGREKRYKTIESIEASGLTAYAEASLKNLFHEKSFTDRKDAVQQIHQIILNTSPASVIGGLKALAHRTETCSMLSEINVPALVVCGREDKITPVAQAEVLKQSIANSTLQIIENAAHLSNLEQPDAFNTALDSFLKGFI
jgi:pimeloyl-ACP methyl ester carboxylesterase